MRAIDGEELMDRVDFILSRVKTPEIVSVFQKLKSYLENAPTITLADLRPKGRWKLADDGDGVVCSECGSDFCILAYATDDFRFCPSCGADMRGGDTQ